MERAGKTFPARLVVQGDRAVYLELSGDTWTPAETDRVTRLIVDHARAS